MMKMMILAPRRPAMSHAEFRRYVTQVHGPLVQSVSEVAAYIRHYHYNFPVPGAPDPAFGHPVADHLDIVTQGWFDSHEALLENMAEPRYLSIVRPDEGRFADEARAIMHCTQESIVRDGPATLDKVFYFRRRHASLTRESFQRAWRERFPAALGSALATAHGIGRYVQNLVMAESLHPDGADAKYFDVIDEFQLTSPAGLGGLASGPPVGAAVSAVERELLDPARTRVFVARTVYNIP